MSQEQLQLLVEKFDPIQPKEVSLKEKININLYQSFMAYWKTDYYASILMYISGILSCFLYLGFSAVSAWQCSVSFIMTIRLKNCSCSKYLSFLIRSLCVIDERF